MEVAEAMGREAVRRIMSVMEQAAVKRAAEATERAVMELV